MEAVEFLGISFRSAAHLEWFYVTIGLFIGSVVLFPIFLWAEWYLAPLLVWGVLGGLSATASINAIRITDWGTNNDYLFSGDCIWYNGLLAIIYFAFAAVYVFEPG